MCSGRWVRVGETGEGAQEHTHPGALICGLLNRYTAYVKLIKHCVNYKGFKQINKIDVYKNVSLKIKEYAQ